MNPRNLRAACLILLLPITYSAHAQYYSPPEISEWEYRIYRCDSPHGPFQTEEEAIAHDAPMHYEKGCGWELADPDEWAIDGEQVAGCMSLTPYPQYPKNFSEIESRNAKSPDIRYWDANECQYEATDSLFLKRYRTVSCPDGQSSDGRSLCFSDEDYGREQGKCEEHSGTTFAGNPIHLPSGNKFQAETDLQLSSSALEIRRYYNSRRPLRPGSLGPHWRLTYDRQIAIPGNADYGSRSVVIYIRDDGKAYTFRKDNGTWSTSKDLTVSLTESQVEQDGGLINGYSLQFSDRREHYAADGRLLTIDFFDHRKVTLQYGQNDQLSAAIDSRDRTIQFSYSRGLLRTITSPAGNAYEYSYDVAGRLVTVSYPTTSGGEVTRRYLYDDPNGQMLLTGIEDANGNRYATWTYDENGLAVESHHGLAADHVTIDTIDTDTVEVTDSAGNVARYDFQTVNGIRKLTQTSSANCGACDDTAANISYNADGLIASKADYNGNTTTFSYNDRGLEISRTEAAGTPAARSTTTSWHPDFQLPTQISTANRLVALSYNAAGQILSRTISDQATGSARGWTYTYCSEADANDPSAYCPIVGLRKSVDGPRTDLADSTQYFYYTDNAADGSHHIGDLWQVVNAEGHVTEYLSYDAAGRVLAVQGPNGVITRFAYDALGRLTERHLVNPDGGPDAVTAFAYDAAGNLVQVAPPSGAAISYEYDTAHRLVAIEDAAGDRIEYTLDAAGNRIEEQVLAADGALFQARTREYNTLNRLVTDINGVGDATSYTYDAEGNRTATTDPKAQVNTHQYDALNRLTGTMDALDGVTSYAYDAQDHLTAVTDPKGLTTHYSYDALDNLLQLDSPDTGATTYTHDAAGNRISQTDARGVTVGYSYDALGRLTAVSYPDSSLDVTLSYDEPDSVTGCSGSYPQGRLTRMTDAAGSTTYCYDHRGNVTEKTQVVDGFSFTLGYGYDEAGRLTSVTYPGLGTLGLTYSASHSGQVASLTWNGQPFLGDVNYAPFGPVAGWDFANGRQVNRGFDPAGRIETIGGSLDLVLDYGPAGNLKALYPPESPPDDSDSDDGNTSTTATEPSLEQYAYDALNRLTEVQDGSGAFLHRWSYDTVGNRLSEETPASGGGTGDGGDQDEPTDPTSGDTQGGLVSYGYAADSHHLLDVGGTPRSYDAAGNTVQKGNLELVYNDANRLAEVRDGAATLASYTYNGRGERVRKTANSGTTYFVYGEGGKLLFEYNTAGTLNAYLWLGDLLVGAATFEGTFAIETDHLGTPRLASNLYGSTAWRWPQFENAFGDREARAIQDGDGPGLELNLRFPGQYHDPETGLHYNYFRDYEPATGRYIESDPIGLSEDINTYTFSKNNVINNTDPFGLFSVSFGGGGFGHLATLGGGGESGFMVDHGGTACFYTRQCSTVGLGLAGSIGLSGGIGSGRLCSGTYGSAGAMSVGGFGIGTAVSTEITGRDSPRSFGFSRGMVGPSGGRFGGFVGCRYDLHCFNESDECNDSPCSKK